MSYESRNYAEEGSSTNSGAIVSRGRREAQHTSTVQRGRSGSVVQYTSAVVMNIRQLHTELNAQHQHEKSALNELNQRFHLFVDRVHQLQTENSRYAVAIAELRRHHSGYSSVDAHTNDNYLAITSNLSVVRGAMIDYQWDFELFQIQAAIFRKLIEIEQQHIKGPSVLEEELKHSSSALMNLRSSFGDLHRKVEILYAECEDLFKQYLTLTHDWCIAKKQRAKWEMSLQILKNTVVFYKNLKSYSVRGVDVSSVTVHTGDITEYWRAEFAKIVKQVRHDFQAFYSTVYREMTSYYETKSIEMAEIIKEEAQEQVVEVVGFSANYERYQLDYEKVQQTYSYEREALIKLEASHSKLESEYNSLHVQYEDRFQSMSAELYSLQESIMAMAFDVDELRTSKASLESEIIIYRLLLGVELTQHQHHHVVIQQPVVVPHQPVVIPPQPTESIMTGKISVKKQKRRSIGINECAPNGKYISLINHSSSKDIDVSRWQIKQHVDSTAKVRYTIPDGIRIVRGGELRIYAQSGSNSMGESSSYLKLMNNDMISWGMGNSVETLLFNKSGDEEASYTQTISFG